ncbi:unnamed protein product [Rotaria sp. Silwood2]|nr:unnamed protein product [Rotaria sp. Silwood2]
MLILQQFVIILHKLSELLFQLIYSQREDDLFNYDFIHSKLLAMPLNNCIFDYKTLFEFNYDKEVKLMSDAFRLSSSVQK